MSNTIPPNHEARKLLRTAGMPLQDRSRGAGLALRNSYWTKAARTYANMFEGQLALALTPYAQVTDLAVNTAASGNNAAAIQSLDDRVTAELASKLDSSALAPAIAPLATAHHGRTGGSARKQHRRAAELADPTRQTSRPSTCWRAWWPPRAPRTAWT